MHSACGRYTITFNGEIYNYRELRAELGRARLRASAAAPTPRCCCSSMPTAAPTWSRQAARHVRLRPVGCRASARCCWRAMRWASSRSTGPTTAGRCASPRRPRRCWPAARCRPRSRSGRHRGLPPVRQRARALHRLARASTRCRPAPRSLIDAAGPRSAAALLRRRRRAGRARQRAAMAIGDARRLLSDAVRDSVRHHLVADVPVAVFLSAGLDFGRAARHHGASSARAIGVGRHAGLRRVQGPAARRGAARRRGRRSATARATSCARSTAPSSRLTCRRSSTRWTCRPSTASTPGSSPRPRTRRASRWR